MSKNPKIKLISDQKEQQLLKDITAFFYDERGEEIGIIAAQAVLDFFLKSLAPTIYNKGVDDASDFIKERLEGLELDLQSLLKQT